MKKLKLNPDKFNGKTVLEIQEMLQLEYRKQIGKQYPLDKFKDVAEGILKFLNDKKEIVVKW